LRRDETAARRTPSRREHRLRIFRSVRLRMAASHASVLALIVLVLGLAGYFLLARSLDSGATTAVRQAALAEVDRVQESGKAVAPADSDVPSSSTVRTALYLPTGVFGEGDEVPSWLRPQSTPTATIVALGEKVRLVTAPVVVDGKRIGTVVAGRSLAPEARLLRRVRWLLFLGGLAGVAISLLAGWLLAGRAMKPVRRAYEAQASFAADASHELRTPLAFVRSGVEVLARHEPALGEVVLDEVQYLTGLTERLLTIARAHSGTVTLDLTAVDVGALCRASVRRNQHVLGESLRLEVRGEPVARADSVALAAAMDAVLENVGRYGGAEATMTCGVEGGTVSIRIADRGPGLSEEQRVRAFDRFFRADPARTRGSADDDRSGAGLGLTLARSLVEAQGGRMWLEETPGGGLTAVIQVPAETEPRPSFLHTAQTAF
jgi:signal transduction histidine kinase